MVIALTIAAMFSLLGGVGTGAAYRGDFALAAGDVRMRLSAAYAAISTVGSLLAAAAAAAAALTSAWFIDPALGAASLVLVVGIAAFTQGLSMQTTEAWFADGRFGCGARWATASAAAGLVGLVIAGTLSATPASMLAGQTTATLAITGMSAGQLRRAGLVAFRRPCGDSIRHLIRRGWPALGFSVGLSLALRADRYILGIFAGSAAVTLYSLAATLSEVSRTVPQAFGQVLSRRIAERHKEAALVRSVALAGMAVLGSGAAVGLVSWFAIPLVFGAELLDARSYLLLLLVAEVLFTPFTVAAKGLVGGGWTRVIGLIGGVGGLLAVISYCALTPFWKTWGACLATCTTYLALSLWTVTALRRLLTRRDQLGSRHPGRSPLQSSQPERGR
jgi:O-antigen/teichoic acid export membrane protein